jgi:hypothetical protein
MSIVVMQAIGINRYVQLTKLSSILAFLVLDLWNLCEWTFVSNGNTKTSQTFFCKSYQ